MHTWISSSSRNQPSSAASLASRQCAFRLVKTCLAHQSLGSRADAVFSWLCCKASKPPSFHAGRHHALLAGQHHWYHTVPRAKAGASYVSCRLSEYNLVRKNGNRCKMHFAVLICGPPWKNVSHVMKCPKPQHRCLLIWITRMHYFCMSLQ